jgi:leucyl-tRNA synthetase
VATRRIYDPGKIEPAWQDAWVAEGVFKAVEGDDGRPRFYNLQMFPYPSGDMHMGHAEAFGISEAIGLYHRMKGENVLNPIGWDAFGLPAENAALKRGVHPKEWTYANIAQQRSTLRRYGCAFDWDRQLNTCDPDYYRWTQWIFLQLFDRGLAYRKTAPANWCPEDQTVLANEQVVAGRCERCGTLVIRKDLTQWFFKITDYADRLLDDMAQLEDTWTDRVLTQQRNWIGRSEGAEVTFRIEETGDEVTVFTTRPDTLWGVTFFVFAPEHPLVASFAERGGVKGEVDELLDRLQRSPVAQRGEEEASREGIRLNVHAVNPASGDAVPCYVAPYVLMEYGTGAVMGVPAHDQRDFEFARAHGLPVRVVIQPQGEERDAEAMTEPYDDEGLMVNSGPLDGTPSPDGIPAVIAWLAERGVGRAAVSYRLRDWLISRQRYWGAPIPIIHCPACGEVGVPEEDLPVLLPDDVDFSPQGVSPLASNEEFVNVTCPKCGGAATRETDTMDTFVDSSWYFLRFTGKVEDRAFSTEEVAKWMPVTQYTGGIEHAILHLLYSRFVVKVLHDIGLMSFVEPFTRLLNQGMVINEGAALSKSKGNVVEPLPLIERWGADAIRTTMLFSGPVEDDVDWATVSAQGAHKWLSRVWRSVWEAAESGTVAPGETSGDDEGQDELRRVVHRTRKAVTADMERHRFNVAIAKLMTLTNELVRALDAGLHGPQTREAAESLTQMIAPFAPHMAEELWRRALGNQASVFRTTWPTWDEAYARSDKVVLIVQVDGKVRDRVTVPADASEDRCRELALGSERVAASLDGRSVDRVIVRAPKLVNIVTARSA